LVDVPRLPHCLGHRLLGDGVEYDALNGLTVQRLLFLKDFEDVPGNRLALAVRVGRQDELVSVLDRAGDIIEPFGRMASISQSIRKL
jgi:hypothetical protein